MHTYVCNETESLKSRFSLTSRSLTENKRGLSCSSADKPGVGSVPKVVTAALPVTLNHQGEDAEM